MSQPAEPAGLSGRLGGLEDTQREICQILRNLEAKLDTALSRPAERRGGNGSMSGSAKDFGFGGQAPLGRPSVAGSRTSAILPAHTGFNIDEAEECGEDDGVDMISSSSTGGLQMRSGYARVSVRRTSVLTDGSGVSRHSGRQSSTLHHSWNRQQALLLDGVAQGGLGPASRWRAWNPDSTSRTVYDALVVIALIYDAVAVPLMVGWDLDQGSNSVLAGVWATSVFWTLDLPLCFVLGFRDRGAILMLDLRTTALHYLSRWFVPDLIMVACDWLSQVFRPLRSLRIIRMVRVGKQTMRAYNLAQKAKVAVPSKTLHLATDVLLLLLAIFWANHFVCCVWYYIGRQAGPSWSISWLRPDTGFTWLSEDKYSAAGTPYEYWTSLHWAMTQMTPGSMEVFPASTLERVFNVMTLFFGLLCGSTLVATLTSMMTQYKLHVQGSTEKFNKLQRFLAQQEVDQALAMAIKLQVKARLGEAKSVLQKDVEYLALAPKSLQEALWHCRCMKRMSGYPLINALNKLNADAMIKICYKCVVAREFNKEDTVFEDGMAGESMYFVSTGELKYRPGERALEADLPEGHPRLKLGHGSWCSEPAMWSAWRHLGTMEAASTGETFQMCSNGLVEVLERMPEVKTIVGDYCYAFHMCLKDMVRLSDLADLVDSHELFMGMEAASRMMLAEPVLHKLRSRTFSSHKAIDLLQEELLAGKCHLAFVGNEAMRTVFIVALRIQSDDRSDDSRVLVKVGEVLRENNQVTEDIVMPGIKRWGQSSYKEVVDKMLETELPELIDSVEVDYDAPRETEPPDVRQTDKYQIRTRYLRTTLSACLRGDPLHFGTKVEVGPSAATFGFGARISRNSRGSSSWVHTRGEAEQRAKEILEQQEGAIALRCEGENRAVCKLYLWLTPDDFEVLSQEGALPVVRQWANELDCSKLRCQQWASENSSKQWASENSSNMT